MVGLFVSAFTIPNSPIPLRYTNPSKLLYFELFFTGPAYRSTPVTGNSLCSLAQWGMSPGRTGQNGSGPSLSSWWCLEIIQIVTLKPWSGDLPCKSFNAYHALCNYHELRFESRVLFKYKRSSPFRIWYCPRRRIVDFTIQIITMLTLVR